MKSHAKNKTIKARLAPSPTGQLHLGNAWSFLIAWLACRLENGQIYLRMEDIDPQRAKKEFAQGIMEDLTWLGIDWDIFESQGMKQSVLWQSDRFDTYKKNLETISPYVYKCYCTRKELREMAGAPQVDSLHGNSTRHSDLGFLGGIIPPKLPCRQFFANKVCKKLQKLRFPKGVTPFGGEFERQSLSNRNAVGNSTQKDRTQVRIPMPDIGAPYTGKCRNLTESERTEKENNTDKYCLRLACPPFESGSRFLQEREKNTEEFAFSDAQSVYSFHDLVLGEQGFSLQECGGDFALKRSDNVWAYQLAVVSDDVDMGINQIVRGNDILMSTPRQLYLYDLLQAKAPQYAHIPLLLDEKGDRLAKRHKSLSLAALREKDTSPKKIITYLAHLMGFSGDFVHARALLDHIRSHQNALSLQGLTKSFPWEVLTQASKGQFGILTSDMFNIST